MWHASSLGLLTTFLHRPTPGMEQKGGERQYKLIISGIKKRNIMQRIRLKLAQEYILYILLLDSWSGLKSVYYRMVVFGRINGPTPLLCACLSTCFCRFYIAPNGSSSFLQDLRSPYVPYSPTLLSR